MLKFLAAYALHHTVCVGEDYGSNFKNSIDSTKMGKLPKNVTLKFKNFALLQKKSLKSIKKDSPEGYS